ncbi:filamentous hemagglutinin N-terminal domain-containing protein [Ralstonia pseudosolanacearum]|uniref:two-partner secretion domain-containing protein n=3 Tax=Ralstonia pseudosolanacearum TaxID=1310165 RepID=UPI0026746A37|nr:filamentous hemagglutinin N-terminal domain-containing protein [Ralstonia pseudosolanacearum]MDO3534710.1 filamentous hemagglutinin N-terminal domain-containing protein [Ralstonia pseudosolanacearum]
MRQPVTARARAALEQPRAIALQQEQHGASAGTADPVSRHDRARRSFVARAIAAAVALLSWLGPVQVSWQAARQSAATIALHGTTVDSPFTSWRTTGRLLVRWGLRQAQAGAITDPTAPIRFTPTLTQTTGQGGGVPVINVTTPNASGLSYNLLRSLTVDGVGLILNNSLAGGGTFLGGNVGGNANLAVSGSASTILTQVTGTDPIRINGTVEVFGTPASVVFAAPAGIYTQGAGFTNTPRVTLSTGTPQFLNGSGANVAFDQATAVGFLVNSGRIQIDPAAGSTAGAGIEGTVGAINLIGQTVGVNAPLFAGNQINVIAGNQQVAPVATGTGRAGSDWQVSGTGANGAANSASAQNGLAIDATAFGAMTAGQIKLISTAQGLGVRAAGDLAANTSNVNIDANGDVSVGNVYGQQNVGVTSTGTVTTTGTVKAQQDVALSANGDLTVGGTAQAGNNLTLNAGGNLTGAGNLAAAKALTAVAGDSVKLTGSLNATHLAVSAQGQDGTGDVALGGSVSSPNTITLTAARDLSATGPITTNGDLQATAGRDIAIAGATQSSGATVLNAGRDIGVANMGSVAAGTMLSATTGRNLTVSGGTASGGDTTLTASGGTLATSGTVLAGGNVTANGQAGTTLGGTVYAAKGVTAQSSAGATSATGSVVAHSGNVALTGTSVAVSGSTQSGGDTALRATQGDATIDGQAAALGKLTVTASQDITGQGSTASVGDTALTAGHDIALTGSSQTAGNLAATAGNRLALSALPVVGGDATLNGVAVVLGASGKTSQVNGTLTATGTQSLATAGTINTATANLTGGTVTNSGTVSASKTLTVAGTTITNSGTLGGATATVHGADVANAGPIGGQTVSVTADNTLSNQNGTLLGTKSLAVAANTLTSNRNGVMFAGSPSGTTAGQGDLSATVSGGSGSFNNAGGQILAGNNATINLRNQTVDGANLGTINANGALTYNVGGVANTGAWTVGGKSATINAANGIANTGSIQHAGDLTLSTPGAVTNSGQIIAGNDLAVSGGSISNAAGATLHADHDLSVTGATTNRGMVEALNDVKIAGAGYDNAGALTQANRDLNVNVSGNVLNQGGTIGAGRDVNLSAGQIINDATASGGASTTVVTGQEVNPTYLSQIVIGREQLSFSLPGSEPGSPDYMPIYRAVTIGDLKPDANGVIYGYLATELVRSLHDQYVDFWHLGSMVDHPATALVTLPTVTRTETTTQAGVSGIIRAGRNLAVTASTLSNNGGQISAAGNITMAVGALNNGASAGASKTITESIDGAVLNSFMAQLYDALHSGTKPMFSDAVMSDGCSDGCPTPHWFVMQTQVVPGTFHTVPAATPPAPQVTVQQTAGKQGVIAAGGSIDLTQVGTLNNGGQIAAAGNISLGGSVNNVGQQLVNRTTLPGCVGNPATCTNAVGNSFSGTSAGPWDSPTYDVIDPKQQVASIVAGGTLTANAAQLTNQTGTITAAGNVLITAPTVTNTGGTIQSKAGSVTINAANGLVNQAAPTTTVHQSHGSDVGPCGKSGSGNCDTATQTATGDAGMILAAGDLTVNAGSVRNNGGAMVAGGNNTITTGSFDNSPVFLRQYYHWMFLDQDSNASDRWGCDSAGDISGCQRAFGGNLRNGTNANAENAPTIGALNSYVSGGNLTIRSGGAIINSGNIEGTAISLSGATITNGITNPSIQTPPSTSGRQVVSLGPIGTANAQLPVTGTPDTFSGPTTVVQQGVPNPSNPGTANGRWQFNPVVVTTQSGGAVAWHFNTPLDGAAMSAPTASGSTAQYLSNSPATAVLGGVGPQTLINALPADLRPGGTPFYYDPQAENQRLDQAALAQTGRTSFINGLTYDSQTHLTVDDQQKLILYQNAVDYAKAHSVQLGQALTPEQLAALDKPMLWYVTQQVPDPNCLSGACPMVSALVPQVYLPQGYSGIEPGGSIVASKSLELLADSPIRNTGTLGSYGTLTSNTTIINEQRAAEMTAAWQPIEDGWARTTGQQGQANSGFVFAANAADIGGQIRNINGVVAQLNADGSMSAAEVARVAAAVQAGMQVVTSTHTDTFVRSPDVMGEIFAGVVIAAIAVMTGGALGPALSGLASGTFGATVTGGAVGSMTGSAIGQFAANDGINFGKLFTAGAVGALTAGIANGVTVGADGSLGAAVDWSQKVADNSLAGLAGAQSVPGTTMTQAATSAAPNFAQQAEAVLLMSGATAAINTVANGGSFGRAFLNSVVSNAVAIGAYAIGDGTGALTLENIAAHAALGCVASAAQGTGCAGGAIGAATSAAITPFVLAGLDPNGAPPDLGLTTAVTAIAALAGGGAATAMGQNASAAATWAQNEALNNDLKHFRDVVDAVAKWKDAAKSGLSSALDKVTDTQALYSRSQRELDAMSPQARALMSRADSFEGKPASELDPAEIRRTIVELNVAAQDPSLTVMQRNWMHNAALRAYMVAGQYGWLVNDIGLVTNAAVGSMAFSGGGVGRLPGGAGQDNVLPTTTGSRTAVTLSGATNAGVSQADLEALAANGVKFSRQDVIATGRTQSGQIVFLETGTTKAGLEHIIDAHGAEFAGMGVSPKQIPDVVMRAVTQGKLVGYQGSGVGRPIYEVDVNGQQQRIAVTVGSNGFIVGANPRGRAR